MSDTNRVAVGLIEETTAGTTPTSPAFQALRITSANDLSYNPTTVVSNELRPDRQVTDLITVGAEPGGSVEMEVSYGALDMAIEGAMSNDWVEFPEIQNTASDTPISDVAATTDTITVTSGGSDFKAGMVIYNTGFTNAANNGIHRVASSTASTVVTEDGLVDEAVVPAAARIKVVGFRGASGDLVAVASTSNQITSTLLNFTTLGLVAGMWIKIGNASVAGQSFATVANNSWARISTVAANALTLDRVPTGWASDAGASKTIAVWVGDYIRNVNSDGTVNSEKTYTIEETFTDHSPETYQYIRGASVNTFSLDVPSQEIATASISFMGRTAAVTETRISGASTINAPANDVINTSSNIGVLYVGSNPVSSPNYVLSLSLEINNNLRRNNAVAVFGTAEMGQGEFGVSGTIETYFGNYDLYQNLINNTEVSYAYPYIDNGNQVYFVDIPRIKFSSGNPGVGGKNDDVILPLEYQGIREATLGYTAQFQKFDYIA